MNFDLVLFLTLKHGITHWTELYLITHGYRFVKLPDRIEDQLYAKVINYLRIGFSDGSNFITRRA